MAYIGVSPSNGVRRVHTYTATANQTTFTGSSTEGVTLTYADTNYIDVFQNGVLLGSADYTSTSGTSVVLAQGASVSDLVVIVVYDVFSVADTVSKTAGGSFDSGVTMSSTLGVTGASTLTGALSAKGGAVFNEDSADVDFRVESNTRANAFFVDGATGNVGIGVTPEVYVSSAHAIDMGNYGGILEQDEMNITSNVYLNTSSSLRYKVTDEAVMYKQTASGKHIFYVAPSGSADAAITFKTAMNIVNNTNIQMPSNTHSVVGVEESLNVNCFRNSSGEDLGIFVSGNDAGGGTHYSMRFYNNQHGILGTISHSSVNSTQYNTSSDYRLKENITYDFDATTRLKQLKPCRFNFIADPNTTIDGFIAHEVTAVPEAVSGKKDAMFPEVLYVDGDEIPDGKKVGDVKTAKEINPQGIDQSKLVPLLVKTIQELEARITALENA